MAKKCKFEKNKRALLLIGKYAEKRAALKALIVNPESTTAERLEAYKTLNGIPRNSSKVRFRNRCELSGRPRAFLRKFRLCRVMFRDLALEGKLPGVTKSSW